MVISASLLLRFAHRLAGKCPLHAFPPLSNTTGGCAGAFIFMVSRLLCIDRDESRAVWIADARGDFQEIRNN